MNIITWLLEGANWLLAVANWLLAGANWLLAVTPVPIKWVFFIFYVGFYWLFRAFSSSMFFLLELTYLLINWLFQGTDVWTARLLELKVWLLEVMPLVKNWLLEIMPSVKNWLLEVMHRSINCINWLLEVMYRSINWLFQGKAVWLKRLSDAWFYSTIWLFEGWFWGCSFKRGLMVSITCFWYPVSFDAELICRFFVTIIQNYLHFEKIYEVFYNFIRAPMADLYLIERDILPKAWIIITGIIYYCILKYRKYRRMPWTFAVGYDEDEPDPNEDCNDGEDEGFAYKIEKHFEANFRKICSKRDFIYILDKYYGAKRKKILEARKARKAAKKARFKGAKKNQERYLRTKAFYELKMVREYYEPKKIIVESKFTLLKKKYLVKLKEIVPKMPLFLKKYLVLKEYFKKIGLNSKLFLEKIVKSKFTLFLKDFKKYFTQNLIAFFKMLFKLTVVKIYEYIVATRKAKTLALAKRSFADARLYAKKEKADEPRRKRLLKLEELQEIALEEAKEAAFLKQYRKEMKEFRVQLRIEKLKNDQAFKQQQEWIKRFFD